MDRDTELKKDYEEMSNLMARFAKQRTKIEGNWYLVEGLGEQPTIEILDDLDRETLRRLGYSLTAVIVFSKNETRDENNSDNSNR